MSEIINIRGVNFNNVTFDETVTSLLGYLESGKQAALYTPNSEIVQNCIENPELYNVINSGEMIVPDGIGVVKAAQIVRNPIKERAAGYDISIRLMERMEKEGLGKVLDDEFFISEMETITFEGEELENYESLEDWILGRSGEGYIEICRGLIIYEDTALELFAGELYQPANESGKTYAQIIYDAEKPMEQVEEYIKNFTRVAMQVKLDDVKMEILNYERALQNGTFEWD